MRVGDPQWTARVERDQGAQDPLAMDRVTDRLLRDLLPGITSISPRPRYIAHHLWALANIKEHETPESRAQLNHGIYQRERIFLLAGTYHGRSESEKQHTGLVGVREATRQIEADTDTISLDFSFASSRSGSYGQNYVGPLQTMGLVETPEGAELAEPSERSNAIAEAYETVASTVGLPEIATAEELSRDQLDTIAAELCPCAVSDPDAPDREPLRAIYLGYDSSDTYATQARIRRESLALILYIALLDGDTVPLEPRTLVNTCYYGATSGTKGTVHADIPAGLERTAARWKALRAHDYFGYATEALLTSWLAYLKRTDEADASLEAFKKQAHSERVCQLIADRLGRSTLTSDTPLSTVTADLWPAATATALRDEGGVDPVPLTHDASEYTLDGKLQTALSEQDWQQVHATWPCLLIALTLRFADPTGADAQAWEWLRSHTEGDLSPVRLREHLRMKLDAETSFGDFVEWYIDEYLITRAIEVAAGKSSGSEAIRGYFEQTGVGWRHVRDHTPGHWNARFDSAVSVLRDLALLEPDSSETDLTPAGIELLETTREEPVDAN